MNGIKKLLCCVLAAVIMLLSFSTICFADGVVLVPAYPGQTVSVKFTVPNCYGISGNITYANGEYISSVKPVASPYGQITDKMFILSSAQKVDCVVELNVTIKEDAPIGQMVYVSLSDYIRIDNAATLEGPEGLAQQINILITKKPQPQIQDTSKIFKDVESKIWFKKYVDYAYTYGIFTGTSSDTFSPNANITRAQFVQVLANLEGVDTSNRNVKTMFTDVPAKKWYTAAVKWASENKVVNGMGDGTFAPDANVTREQMCLMLTNFASFKKITLKQVEAKALFADDAKIAKWAKTAVYVCQQADIVNGKGENKFDPKGTGTRAEAAVIFTKFHQDYIMQ